MTILIHDAKQELLRRVGPRAQDTCVGEILYADDTLLVGVHGGCAQEYMTCVAEAGEEYGLAFNVDKLGVLCSRCNDHIVFAGGQGRGGVGHRGSAGWKRVRAPGRMAASVRRIVAAAYTRSHAWTLTS